MSDLERQTSRDALAAMRARHRGTVATPGSKGGSARVLLIRTAVERPYRMFPIAVAGAAVAVLLASLLPSSALADDAPTLSGQWSASGLSEQWSTSDWGDACGPKPASQGAPGGTVTITEQGGELAMSGAGRSYTTAQCWEQMPGLTRSSHSAGKRGWTTRCTSASGDPRHATIVTSVIATDDVITLSEQGQYEFFIEGTTCRASVSRSRSFKLIQRAGDAPPATSASATPVASAKPKPPPAEPSACSEPGAPVVLEVRPSKKLLRPGEDFSLKAFALDDKGCLTGATPKFRVGDGASDSKVTVDEKGKVAVGGDAPEGVTKIVVELGGKSVEVSIEVAKRDRYDALLAERGLDANGEDTTAARVAISAGVGGAPTTSDDLAKRRKQIFVAIVAGLAALLALAGFVLTRRGRRAAVAPARTTDDELAAAPNVELFERAPDQPMRCPQCDAVYPADVGFCSDDGSPLVPASVGPSKNPAPAPPRAKKKELEKICPTCGDRFEATASFCGKDGTSLVPIN